MAIMIMTVINHRMIVIVAVIVIVGHAARLPARQRGHPPAVMTRILYHSVAKTLTF